MAQTRTSSWMIAFPAILAITLSVAGCTSSAHPAPKGAASSSAAATRWWSNSAVAVGSPIDASNPTAAARALQPSRAEYCGMLKQTLQAGKSLLASGSASDPKLLTSSEAFVAEIQALAPAAVSGSWQVLGPVIVQLVKAGGALPTGSSAGSAQNLQAATAINADSKSNCGLDLSPVATGG
ncbi:MAG: hypothetical protein M3N95_00900 [Actinomycetota bacterium]|nr:hypothetical protein [Actinomycetota bacterium]